jgi:aspartate-semialdehyde dehydrogenase
MKLQDVAVVGATGLVGRKIVQLLEERDFPIARLRLLASERSVGKSLDFKGKAHPVEKLTHDSFAHVEIALFSAGGVVSKEYAPYAVKAGALVIDNSSAFRMDPHVPLIVPEINPRMIAFHKGIIANPNCSTIQMVVVLKPLHDRWKIKRIVVSTYQAVTGAGQRGVVQLEGELGKHNHYEKKFPHPIAFNCLPQVDEFLEDGYTREEHKMVNETRKILADDTIHVTATCVRVPVLGGHSESVNVEFEKPFGVREVVELLRHSPGVCVQDDFHCRVYPMPINSNDRDAVFVGRIRRDDSVKNGLNLWIVADSLRKGAATNAVQIAEEWLKRK